MATLESILAQIENVKVIDSSIHSAAYTAIDLSILNVALSKIDMKNTDDFEKYLKSILKKNNAKVGFGGYNEIRNLYKTHSIFNNNSTDERNIHIGLDLWIDDRTAVLAALDGKVYGFCNNSGAGNYGPTIILEHNIEHHVFYTLYGHLSVESLDKIRIGSYFSKGLQIASIGNAKVNGGYPPHLHFQIIKNMQNNRSDYPGVCSHKDLAFYLDNCPNPNLLLKMGNH